MLVVSKHLNRFGKNVVKGAKRNASKMSGDGDLKHSIEYDLKVHKNSFSLSFYMVDYGIYLDEGVRGAGGVRKSTSKFGRNNKGKMWKQKAPKSRFSYKKGANNRPSPKHFKKWAREKGLNPFAIATAVQHQGIKPTHFFSDAFEKEFLKLPDDIVEAYGLDVDEFLEQVLNN